MSRPTSPARSRSRPPQSLSHSGQRSIPGYLLPSFPAALRVIDLTPNSWSLQSFPHGESVPPVALMFHLRPQEFHTGQGLKVGLYTPTILGGNSYLSWFYDRGAMKYPAHTGPNQGLSRAINRRPIRKFLPNYANVCVTIQSHGLSTGARTICATANKVRNGLVPPVPAMVKWWHYFPTALTAPKKQGV